MWKVCIYFQCYKSAKRLRENVHIIWRLHFLIILSRWHLALQRWHIIWLFVSTSIDGGCAVVLVNALRSTPYHSHVLSDHQHSVLIGNTREGPHKSYRYSAIINKSSISSSFSQQAARYKTVVRWNLFSHCKDWYVSLRLKENTTESRMQAHSSKNKIFTRDSYESAAPRPSQTRQGTRKTGRRQKTDTKQ